MRNQKEIIFITGASRGLGRALVHQLSELEHYIVYGACRNPNELPNDCIPLRIDLTQEETFESAINEIISREGRIDVVINNAGIAYYGPIDSMSLKEVRELFEINVFGTFRLTQVILPYMRKQKSGKILFTSSIRGVESHAYMGMYSATKAAIEAIAFDWATTLTKWNIQVSIIQPGPLDSGIELKHGNYFKDITNPYLPYANFQVQLQSTESAAKAIVDNLIKTKFPPFRYQTSIAAESTVKKHLIDISGNSWLQEQRKQFNC